MAGTFIIHTFAVPSQQLPQFQSSFEMEMNFKLMTELEAMGFSKAQVAKALCSGNSNIEAAINWIINQENDMTASEMTMDPHVAEVITIDAVDSSRISEHVKLRAQKLRNQAHQNKAEAEKKLERREKERIRAGNELLDAKSLAEEMDRKRFLAQQKLEKEEERRARERIRQKLQQDKLERRSMLGIPSEGSKYMNHAIPQKTKNFSIDDPALSGFKPMVEREIMRECLRYLKHRNKEDNAQVMRAFQTLFIYVKNVAKNPDEGKFRKIRISNPAFQDRVGKFEEGVKFLELCGFEVVEGGKYLFLAREMVDMSILKTAANELQNALTNPFFGLLSA